MPNRTALVQNTGPGNLSGDLWDLIGASCGPKFRRNQARPVCIAFLLFTRQSATGKMASIWAHNFHFAAINLRGVERDVPHSLGVRPLVRIGNTLPPARGRQPGTRGGRHGRILQPADGIFTCIAALASRSISSQNLAQALIRGHKISNEKKRVRHSR